jgi:hypothetical protein
MNTNIALSQIEQLVKLALENVDTQTPKGIPRSVRFPEEMDKRVNGAMEILGCDRTEIVVECVRMNFEAVVQAMIDARERRAKEWKKAGAFPAPADKRANSGAHAQNMEESDAAAPVKRAIRPAKPPK